MSFDHDLSATVSYGKLESFARFRAHIEPAWIENALEATGIATLRRRRLPADQVVWLVIGMALFRDRAIEEVVDKLDLALPSPHGVISKSAVAQARKRMGAEPMQWVFERSAEEWAHRSADGDRWRGLALYGIDGSSLRVADTETNRAEFGGWKGKHGPSSHPLVRIVVLMALRSHLLAAANFGSYDQTSEVHHGKLLQEKIPAASLTIVDCGFFGAPFLLALQSDDGTERHWLTRAKHNSSMRMIERFGDGDRIVEMKVSAEARATDPSLPKTWRMRAIRYSRPGFPVRTLLTSMLDPKRYPAAELVELYHERWELELGYDEIKTEMLDREETLRSMSPDGVRQEIWGILLAFNLVRLEMERVAREVEVAPTRISFVAALHLVRDELEWSAVTRSPGAIPKHLTQLRQKMKRFILPERRSGRVYPRKVKNNFGRYPKRRGPNEAQRGGTNTK